MKKLFFLALLTLVMFSCNRNEQYQNEPLQELTSKDISFVNYTKILNNEVLNIKVPSGGSVGFEFTLGRKSRNCHGFGICELTAFWVEIYKGGQSENPADSKFTGLIIEEEASSESKTAAKALLVLDNDIDENTYDTTFYVDEDVYLGTDYIIMKGEYQLDNSIGNFGGYSIPVQKL